MGTQPNISIRATHLVLNVHGDSTQCIHQSDTPRVVTLRNSFSLISIVTLICILTKWLRSKQLVLTWAPPTPVSECFSMAKWRSLPMTRETGQLPPMWHLLTPRG